MYIAYAFSKRCDSKTDCLPDRSDEQHCQFVQPDETYIKEIVPSGKEGNALEVKVMIDIIAITAIDTVATKFTVDFNCHLGWTDERLKFEDLNDEYSDNTLSSETKQRMWYPTLKFTNALGILN